VWRYFVDPARRVEWVADVDTVTVLDESAHEVRWHEHYRSTRAGSRSGAELRLVVLTPGRRCRVGLAAQGSLPHRIYAFTPIEVGPDRGGTMVTAIDDRPALLADRLFDLVVGGFVARTVEGAVRKELDALAAACTTRVVTAAS
jgi:hypothetical protein